MTQTTRVHVIENDLINAWLCGGWRNLEPAKTPVKVIYPGRRRPNWGPDFADAVVIIDGRRLTGDVEIHVDAGEWYTHRHHLNPAYNSTILHVVIRNGNTVPAVTADGRIVTQARLPLSALNIREHHCMDHFSCHGHNVSNIIRTTGAMRFQTKRQHFDTQMRYRSPDEVLYRGIADALAYRENRAPMGILTEAITLTSVRDSHLDRHLARLKALILWKSGLLTESSTICDIEALGLWQMVAGRTDTPIMGRGHWCFARVRPVNSPLRRLVALAHLVHRHSASRLFPSLMEPLHQRTSTVAIMQTLREKLVITGHDYWATHWDFARPLSGPYALLGEDRASDIITNVILPFASALGTTNGDRCLSDAAIEVYNACPARSDNEVSRYMSQLLSHPVRTTCEEQGLMYIYHNWCREKRCGECPAGLQS